MTQTSESSNSAQIATQNRDITEKNSPLKYNNPQHPLSQEDRKKGGSRKTEAKHLAAVIRHLMAKPDLTETQKQVLLAIKEKKLDEAALALISKQLITAKDQKETDAVIMRITNLIPQKTVNMNLEKGEYTIKIKYERED